MNDLETAAPSDKPAPPPGLWYYTYPTQTGYVPPTQLHGGRRPRHYSKQTPGLTATYRITATRNCEPSGQTDYFFIQVAINVSFAASSLRGSGANTYQEAESGLDTGDGMLVFLGRPSQSVIGALQFYNERLITGLNWDKDELIPAKFIPPSTTGTQTETTQSTSKVSISTSVQGSFTSQHSVTNSVNDWTINQNYTATQVIWYYQIASPYAYPNGLTYKDLKLIQQLPALSMVGGTLSAAATLKTNGTPSSVTLQPFLQLGLASFMGPRRGLYVSFNRYTVGDTSPGQSPFVLSPITIDLTKVPAPS